MGPRSRFRKRLIKYLESCHRAEYFHGSREAVIAKRKVEPASLDEDSDEDSDEDMDEDNFAENFADSFEDNDEAEEWRPFGVGTRIAEEDSEERRPRGAGTRIEGPGGHEVQFADDLWCELLEKGFICGDERRLLGEDRDGNITIVQF